MSMYIPPWTLEMILQNKYKRRWKVHSLPSSPDHPVRLIMIRISILHFPVVTMASCHWHLRIMSYRFFHVIYKTAVSFTVIVVTPFFHDHIWFSPRTKKIWNIISEVIIWKHTILQSQHPDAFWALEKLRFSLELHCLGLSQLSTLCRWSVVFNQSFRKSL